MTRWKVVHVGPWHDTARTWDSSKTTHPHYEMVCSRFKGGTIEDLFMVKVGTVEQFTWFTWFTCTGWEVVSMHTPRDYFDVVLRTQHGITYTSLCTSSLSHLTQLMLESHAWTLRLWNHSQSSLTTNTKVIQTPKWEKGFKNWNLQWTLWISSSRARARARANKTRRRGFFYNTCYEETKNYPCRVPKNICNEGALDLLPWSYQEEITEGGDNPLDMVGRLRARIVQRPPNVDRKPFVVVHPTICLGGRWGLHKCRFKDDVFQKNLILPITCHKLFLKCTKWPTHGM